MPTWRWQLRLSKVPEQVSQKEGAKPGPDGNTHSTASVAKAGGPGRADEQATTEQRGGPETADGDRGAGATD